MGKQQEGSMLEKERAQSDVYKNALSGISGGLGKTSDELSKMAQKMDEKNVSQYARLDKIAEQKTAVQKERRQTIQQLSEMTSEIENATTESRDLDMCISALITAVGCMRIVKVYLSDIALFWKNVAKFCNGMVENIKGLNEEIGNFSDIEDYCELFLQQEQDCRSLFCRSMRVSSRRFIRHLLKGDPQSLCCRHQSYP